MKFKFGKYKGCYIYDVPTSYLVFIYESSFVDSSLKQGVKDEIVERLTANEIKNTNSDMNIRKVYLEMSKKYHPDKGGTTKEMQVVNDFYNCILNNS